MDNEWEKLFREKLFDCPFCGGKPQLFYDLQRKPKTSEITESVVGVSCFCGASIHEVSYSDDKNKEKARACVDKWNRRV